MITKNLRIVAISLGVMAIGALSSCTSESGYLNQLPGGSASTFNLVQTPDVVAYSGDNYFNSSFTASSRSSRSGETPGYLEGWSMPETCPEKPGNALDFTTNSITTNNIYYIDKDYQINWKNLEGNNVLYICNGANVSGNLNFNGSNNIIYIEPGATFTVNGSINPNVKIYNYGEFILNGTLNSGSSLFNDGMATFKSDYTLYLNDGVYSKEILYIEGDVSLQNAANFKACGLDVTGELTLNFEGTLNCNYIKANSLSMNKDKVDIQLGKKGFVYVNNLYIGGNPPGNAKIICDSGDGSVVVSGTLTIGDAIRNNNAYSQAFVGVNVYTNNNDVLNALGERGIQYNTDIVIPPAEGDGCSPGLNYTPPTDPEPDPEDPKDPDPVPPTPNNPGGVMKYSNNVEVNLSLEKHNIQYTEYQATHVSIHVRHDTDVEVFIPLPFEYVCEADDFAIAAKHDYDETRIPKEGSRQFTIGDLGTVYMYVTHETEGVRIKTDGINKEIIEYLGEQYGDGLTFEVWVYTNIEHSSWETGNIHGNLSKAILKGFLNGTKVKFLDSEPDLYVNSFNSSYNFTTSQYEKFEDDYTVDIDDSNKPSFYTGVQGSFLNGSNFNILYYNKSAK